MKRYALFAHPTYYPWGGWADLVNTYHAVEEVADWLASWPTGERPDEWHVVDLTTGEVVAYGGQDCAPFQMQWTEPQKWQRP